MSLYAHVCVYPQKLEEGAGCPGGVARGSWKPPEVGAGNWTLLLWEQQALWTAEPPLQPSVFILHATSFFPHHLIIAKSRA